MSAVEILDDDIYLGAENNFNLFTVRKNSEGATDEERGRLEVVGEYHLGEFVNRFRHGSLVMRLPDSDVGQIPTVIFGTVNGVIGVIASLPHEQYLFLEKLQSNLRKVIKGVGGLSHEQWRSFNNEKKTVDAKNFLDGDLIESFLDLSRSPMDEISNAMEISVEELCKRVEELTRLHWFSLDHVYSFVLFFFGCFVAHGRIMSCRFGGISKDEPFLVRNPEVYVQHFFKNHVHMLFRDLHVELAYTAADGFFLSGTCIIIKSWESRSGFLGSCQDWESINLLLQYR